MFGCALRTIGHYVLSCARMVRLAFAAKLAFDKQNLIARNFSTKACQNESRRRKKWGSKYARETEREREGGREREGERFGEGQEANKVNHDKIHSRYDRETYYKQDVLHVKSDYVEYDTIIICKSSLHLPIELAISFSSQLDPLTGCLYTV